MEMILIKKIGGDKDNRLSNKKVKEKIVYTKLA